MRIPLLLLPVFTLHFSPSSHAQSSLKKYRVFFTDKEQGSFDPYQCFDVKAIRRRLKSDIPVNHKPDWLVRSSYIENVRNIASSTSHSSRWFNALGITATDNQTWSVFVSFIAIIPKFVD